MEERQPRKLAVILHADVVGSTALVHRDEAVAHERIQDAFHRFSGTIESYNGHPLELRGDALLAEFERVSDAVAASLAFQAENARFNSTLEDDIQPNLRIGISLGEVVFADNTVTGEGVVLAQRLEQLAGPGGVCIQGAVHEAVPGRLPFTYQSLGEQKLKGFTEPVRAYVVALKSGESIPAPEPHMGSVEAHARLPKGRWIAVGVIACLVIAGGVLSWLRPWEPREEPASIERMAFPLPQQPSIAVLPFDYLGGDVDQDYFVDAFTENIITALAKLPKLFVIARNSTFAYKGRADNIAQVAEELGVQYVLEGSVQRSGDRLRVTAQLIDGLTGRHRWAESYDREFSALFAVQDDITTKIVAAMEVELTDGDVARLHRRDTDNPKAYEHLSRGKELVRQFTKDGMILAREELEKALALDPHYGIALGWLGWTHWHDARHRWSGSRSKSLEMAENLAERILALNEETAIGHALLGGVHLLRRDYTQALAEYERAVSLAPNIADAQALMGWSLILVGSPSEAPPYLERAMRLSPSYPPWYLSQLAEAYRLAGRSAEAIEAFTQAVELRPKSISTRSSFIAALMAQDRLDEARAQAAELLTIKPDFNVKAYAKTVLYADPAVREQLLNALRDAGLPE